MSPLFVLLSVIIVSAMAQPPPGGGGGGGGGGCVEDDTATGVCSNVRFDFFYFCIHTRISLINSKCVLLKQLYTLDARTTGWIFLLIY